MTTSLNPLFNMRLGRYQLQERIGMGGMARVFKAHDTNLDRPVAIKILHEHLADDQTFKQRFEREAKFIASINHPNIVQIYDYDMVETETGMIYYMVMPLIMGKTLKTLLEECIENNQPLPHERVLQIMLNLLDALGYAHQHGMVHRDVKPGNILFNERGEAVLADFGIARLAQGSQLTQESVTVGTPAYMSPEQVGGSDVDGRADLYAVGVILYELLASQPPFADEGSLSVLLKHLTAPIPPVSPFLSIKNAALDMIIFKALAKQPEDRYQTAQEFAQDLRQAFGYVTSITMTPPPMNTITFEHPYGQTRTAITVQQMIKQAQRISHSPLHLFGLGIALIAILTGAALFSRGSALMSDLTTAADHGIAPSMTGEFYFTSTFDPNDELNSAWPLNERGIIQQSLLPDGTYSIRNELPSAAHATLFDQAYRYDTATIVMQGSLTEASSRSSAFGIIFNYTDEDNYNVFAVDGAGRFSIWRRIEGIWHELRAEADAWTPNAAINPRGENNWLTLEFSPTRLHGFVNNVTVFELPLASDTLWSGAVGIYTATPEGGIAEVMVNSYQVTSSIPSMTSP